MNWPAGFEHCRSCVHADDMDAEYDYCHVCIMERDCYKPKEDNHAERTGSNQQTDR